MATAKYIVPFVFLLSLNCHAADPWSKEDKYWQAGYTALHLVDWAQSRHIAKHPDDFIERNTILGKDATVSDVNRYFATTLVAHYAITHFLPSAWRRPFQIITVSVQVSAVSHNYRVGIGMDF